MTRSLAQKTTAASMFANLAERANFLCDRESNSGHLRPVRVLKHVLFFLSRKVIVNLLLSTGQGIFHFIMKERLPKLRSNL